MFFVLLRWALSFDQDYSLIFPIIRTNKSEVGNWSIRGSACRLRMSLRLSTISLRHEYGTVCQRAPTVFRDWAVDMDLLVRGSDDRGGRGITFMFTDTVCPEKVDDFRGFQVTFDTGATDAQGNTPVLFSEGAFADGKVLGFAPVRNQPGPVRIRIQRTKTNLLVEYTAYLHYVPILDVELHDTPEMGYFTLFAETSGDFADNNDLTYFRTTPLSEYDRAGVDKALLIDNRKILESNAEQRRELKIARRQAKLKTMSKILSVMSEHQNELTRTRGQPDLRDMLRVLDEAGERGVDSVTIDYLKVFINNHVDATIGEAGRNMQGAMDEIDGYKEAMVDGWNYLRDKLLELATGTRESLSQLESECIDIARTVRGFGELSPAQLEAAARGDAVPRRATDPVPTLLSLIALIEFVGYLSFFYIKHKRTHGFKKID